MRRVKGVEVLREALREFLDEVLYSISEEMLRIERTVKISELEYNPFGSQLGIYVDAIHRQENGTITIETSFSDLSEKTLDNFIAHSKIGYDLLIDLLELLKALEGGYGEPASILWKVENQSIRFDKDDNSWICICRNTPAKHGFHTCDADGNDVDPSKCSDWNHLYRCDGCGRVIDKRNLKVIGVNLSPTIEDDLEDENGEENDLEIGMNLT